MKALVDEIGVSVGPMIKPAPAVKSERPGSVSCEHGIKTVEKRLARSLRRA